MDHVHSGSQFDYLGFDASIAGFDVRDLVSGAIEASATQAKARQLRLKRSVHTLLPHSLHGDSAGIGKILTELVANAVRFTKYGEVFVRAELEDETAAEITVRFSVTTAHQGLSIEAMSEFFERFCCADEELGEHPTASARGMANCKSLVDEVGGEICVEKNVGTGSALSLVVSLARSAAPASGRVVVH